jgi:hypothetical protein
MVKLVFLTNTMGTERPKNPKGQQKIHQDNNQRESRIATQKINKLQISLQLLIDFKILMEAPGTFIEFKIPFHNSQITNYVTFQDFKLLINLINSYSLFPFHYLISSGNVHSKKNEQEIL